MDKKVFYYDEQGLLTVTEPAYLNVLETEKQGKDVYYCPDGGTLEIPPAFGENENVRFNGISWEVVKDFRHKFVVDSSLEVYEVDYIGEIKAGYLLITDNELAQILKDKDYYLFTDSGLIPNPDYNIIVAERKAQKRITEIKSKLNALDVKRIRAMLEPSVKDETTGETWLEYYNAQVFALREELNQLNGIVFDTE